MQGNDERVSVRRHWNGAQSAFVPVDTLWTFISRTMPAECVAHFPGRFYARASGATKLTEVPWVISVGGSAAARLRGVYSPWRQRSPSL